MLDLTKYKKRKFTLTIDEYKDYSDDYAGFCTNCDDIIAFDSVEPDACNYRCRQCNKKTLYGIGEALLQGYIDIDCD